MMLCLHFCNACNFNLLVVGQRSAAHSPDEPRHLQIALPPPCCLLTQARTGARLTLPEKLSTAFRKKKEEAYYDPNVDDEIVSSEYSSDEEVDLLKALAQRCLDPQIRLTRQKGRHVVRTGQLCSVSGDSVLNVQRCHGCRLQAGSLYD